MHLMKLCNQPETRANATQYLENTPSLGAGVLKKTRATFFDAYGVPRFRLTWDLGPILIDCQCERPEEEAWKNFPGRREQDHPMGPPMGPSGHYLGGENFQVRCQQRSWSASRMNLSAQGAYARKNDARTHNFGSCLPTSM